MRGEKWLIQSHKLEPEGLEQQLPVGRFQETMEHGLLELRGQQWLQCLPMGFPVF